MRKFLPLFLFLFCYSCRYSSQLLVKNRKTKSCTHQTRLLYTITRSQLFSIPFPSTLNHRLRSVHNHHHHRHRRRVEIWSHSKWWSVIGKTDQHQWKESHQSSFLSYIGCCLCVGHYKRRDVQCCVVVPADESEKFMSEWKMIRWRGKRIVKPHFMVDMTGKSVPFLFKFQFFTFGDECFLNLCKLDNRFTCFP